MIAYIYHTINIIEFTDAKKPVIIQSVLIT